MENSSNSFVCKVCSIIDDSTIVLNCGKDANIEEGFKFLLYEIGDEIFDPDTNESLGKLEIVKGIGRVDHLQEKLCTLVSCKEQVTKRLTYTGPQSYIQTIPFVNPRIGDLAKYIP